MGTCRRHIRPGFVVLLLTCMVYFGLGWYAACTLFRKSGAAPQSGGTVSAAGDGVNAGNDDVEPADDETLWNLILVNKEHPLQTNLTLTLTPLQNGQSIDARAYPALQAMMDDAREEGLSPLICSSYRTEARQQELYEAKVEEYRLSGYSQADAEAEAARWVAPPGTSEHETGLAVDIVAESNQHLDSTQEGTAEQQWLMEHCWEYGFILRYPPEKSHITGISYEPWHYRYVGREAALAMQDSGQCLEEYLETA